MRERRWRSPLRLRCPRTSTLATIHRRRPQPTATLAAILKSLLRLRKTLLVTRGRLPRFRKTLLVTRGRLPRLRKTLLVTRGILLPLVPRLHRGRHLSARLCRPWRGQQADPPPAGHGIAPTRACRNGVSARVGGDWANDERRATCDWTGEAAAAKIAAMRALSRARPPPRRRKDPARRRKAGERALDQTRRNRPSGSPGCHRGSA